MMIQMEIWFALEKCVSRGPRRMSIIMENRKVGEIRHLHTIDAPSTVVATESLGK